MFEVSICRAAENATCIFCEVRFGFKISLEYSDVICVLDSIKTKTVATELIPWDSFVVKNNTQKIIKKIKDLNIQKIKEKW